MDADDLKQLAARVVDHRLQAGRGDEFSAGAIVRLPSLGSLRRRCQLIPLGHSTLRRSLEQAAGQSSQLQRTRRGRRPNAATTSCWTRVQSLSCQEMHVWRTAWTRPVCWRGPFQRATGAMLCCSAWAGNKARAWAARSRVRAIRLTQTCSTACSSADKLSHCRHH